MEASAFPVSSRRLTFQPCAMGIEAVAREAVEHLTREELKGFFIHLDADCLDDAIMPAVDFRMPGGLSWDELGVLLRVASGSGKAVGIEITSIIPALIRTVARRAAWPTY
ncbi:arginase family enzyme [Shinella sp. BE166]